LLRGKKGCIPIIIVVVLIIILIIAYFLSIFPPPPPPDEEIVATAFLAPPNGLEIPKEPYFGLIPDDFTPDENTRTEAIQRLEDLGFGILNVGKYTITFNGTENNFEDRFSTEIEKVRYSPIGEDFLQEIENAQNPPEPGSERTTFTYMEAITNPIGVNQPVFLHFGITDATGSPGIGWEGLTIELIRPSGTTDTLGPFTTDSTGTLVTTYTPTQIGTYVFQAHFPEQTSPQGAIMLESFSDPLELLVQSEPIFADPIYPESGSVKTTIAYIVANPNPIGVNQAVNLYFGITDATGSPGIGWDGLEVTITDSDGSTSTLSGIMTDSTGGSVTTFVPDQVGSYTLQVHFPEQISSENATMLESISDPLELVVQHDSISDPIYPNAGSLKTTFAYIEALRNPVSVGQQVFLHFGITDATGSPGIGWEGLTIELIRPSGTTDTLGPFTTDSTGTLVTTYTPTQIGSYTLQVHFPEQISSENATMLESISDPLELNVWEDPGPPITDPIFIEFSSPYEDFIQIVENTSDVDLNDFIYVSHQLAQDITIPNQLIEFVDGVALSPPIFSSLSYDANPPNPDPLYYYLNMPDDLKEKLEVTGTTLDGSGINVTIIDSGCYINHPFFIEALNSKITVISSSLVQDPFPDTVGHGTVVAANLLSIARNVDLTIVKHKLKLSKTSFLDPYVGFEKALETFPQMIICSWRCPFDWGIQYLVKRAISENITVVVSCGNYDKNVVNLSPTFPGDIPEVISVGGAYPLEEGDYWQAASYARSGKSLYYNEDSRFFDDSSRGWDNSGNEIYIDAFGVKRPIPRMCPDVCGIVGQQPYGQIIMSPVGIGIDVVASLERHDGTGFLDGWAILSGTSSAAPQVAGAVALMLQIDKNLTPLEVKDILEITATDVKSGVSASGLEATSGTPSIIREYFEIPGAPRRDPIEILKPDNATGYGVINVLKAIEETTNRLDEYASSGSG